MKAEFYKQDKHYEILLDWWKERDFPAIPPHLLPPIGIVVEIEAEPVCAGFLYYTNGGLAIIDHLVADKHYDMDKRSQCIDFLIDSLEVVAKENGFLFVSAASNLKHLQERYERHGFKRYDINVVHFAKEIT
jgi:hypothetical protein